MKDMAMASIYSFLGLRVVTIVVFLLSNPRGGVLITATGSYVDSVEEPIMVVTAVTGKEASVYYQAQCFSYFVVKIL